MNVVSLFAGCGGSSLGYEMAGGRILVAVEWDKAATECYRRNHPKTVMLERDIGGVSPDEILALCEFGVGDLDVLDGSPPCQGFSTAGKRFAGDGRNSLFREYIRLLRGLRPRVFVMENVAGMVKGKMKAIFAEAMRELAESGYRVKARLMDAQWYGVPQERKRVIFIGVRRDLGMEPSFPEPTVKRPLSANEVMAAAMPHRGWGGLRNAQFSNKWRSAGKPAPCMERARPLFARDCDGRVREITRDEGAVLATFPAEYFIEEDRVALDLMGNAVMPKMMAAIAGHICDTILARWEAETGGQAVLAE